MTNGTPVEEGGSTNRKTRFIPVGRCDRPGRNPRNLPQRTGNSCKIITRWANFFRIFAVVFMVVLAIGISLSLEYPIRVS